METDGVKRLANDIPNSKMRIEARPPGRYGGGPTVWMDYLSGYGKSRGFGRDQRFLVEQLGSGDDTYLSIILFDEDEQTHRQTLDRNGLKALLPYLQHFAETGELSSPDRAGGGT